MSNLVTTGKPKVTGAVFRALIQAGSSIEYPTDATTELSDAFVHQGYITEDGVTLNNNQTKETVKAWGGDIVLNNITDKGYTWAFSLMEHLNANVHKTVYGDNNVTVGDGMTTIKATGDVSGPSAWVIDRVNKNGKADRVIIYEADITEVGETTFRDEDAVVYPLTITPVLYDGAYFKEFIEGEDTNDSGEN